MSTEAELKTADDKESSSALRTIGWLSLGITVAAIGIYVGRELRSRYKFSRRTPYDFYANADASKTGDFGIGV